MFNPLTKELFTDDGTYIKQLFCPLRKQWNDLETKGYEGSDTAILLKGKTCKECEKTVYDTSLLNENELQELFKNDPQTCLKIDINQPNLTLTHNTHER